MHCALGTHLSPPTSQPDGRRLLKHLIGRRACLVACRPPGLPGGLPAARWAETTRTAAPEETGRGGPGWAPLVRPAKCSAAAGMPAEQSVA